MADTGDWSTNSTDAITISLVAPSAKGSQSLASFNPKFTYSIFGDEESIFGYQGLKIHLRYHASDMRPSLSISYSKKFKAQGEVVPTDVKEILEEYLPIAAFEKSQVFETNIKSDLNSSWRPPGELLKTITRAGEKLETWKGSLVDKGVQQLLNRIQILAPLFIEGGTFIDLEDEESLDRWTVFFLYKKDSSASQGASPYTFMGYATVYKYYMLSPPTPSSTPLDFTLPMKNTTLDQSCRSRISQFIILPPSQGKGQGSSFYSTIYQYYLSQSSTTEITVEDPNEAFDDLRDYNDLIYLRTLPGFQSLKIDTSVTIRSKGPLKTASILDPEAVDALRHQTKIAPRQFARLVEMHLLSKIPLYIRQSLILEKVKGTQAEIKTHKHGYRLWQLLCKDRLYRHNKQSLMQLDRAERIDKLEEVVNGVEADYARLLREAEHKESRRENGEVAEERADDVPVKSFFDKGKGKRDAEQMGDVAKLGADGKETQSSQKKARFAED